MARKTWFVVNILLILSLILSGCSAFVEPVASRPPLKVEWTIWEGDYTLLIAQEKGFFEKHGVLVEPIFYETFSKVIPDLASKKIDAGLLAVGDLLMVSRIASVKSVAVYDSGGTSTLVSTQDIQQIADLKGKRVGVLLGTSGELFVRESLAEAGLTLEDVSLVNVDPELVPSRLSEDLDAGYVWAPYDQIALANGHKLLSYEGGSEVGTLFPDVIVFRSDIVEDRPEDVRAFVAAWFEALEFRLANQEECNRIIAERTGQKIEDVAMSGTLHLYNRAENLQLFDPANADASIFHAAQVNLDFLVTRGDVTLLPDLEVILDPSFLQ